MHLVLLLITEKQKFVIYSLTIFADDIKTKLYSYVPEAKEIWLKVLKTISEIEHKMETPYNLDEKVKLYALDGIILAESLKIEGSKRRAALQVYSLYYLTIHLLDDLIEDQHKFYSKFNIAAERSNLLSTGAIGVSFIFNFAMAINQFLIEGGYTQEEVNRIQQRFSESCAIQIKCFTSEKNKNISSKKVFEIKHLGVNGESLSFMAECFQIEIKYGKKCSESFSNALLHLGALSQFTDDLRDYEEDKNNNNANLLISMEREFTGDAKSMYVKMYLEEYQKMLEAIKKSGFEIDMDMLDSIPWYPFFMKHLAA